MTDVTITLPDNSTRQFPAGTPVFEVAQGISGRLRRQALAATVNGKMVDLSYELRENARVEIVTSNSPGALELYRHSTAHLLAAAVTALFSETQCGIGPPIEDGFFYDFIVDRPFVPEDLEAIEAKMIEISKRNLRYERKLMPKEEAKAFFRDRGESLKVQLIEEKGGPIVSCYTIEDAFVDFCTGPHVPSTEKLKAFKVLHSSNAYWKGDAQNQPMQRIYGTAFFKESELKKYLHRLSEAKKRDHRKLGKELGLFTFHPWAPGAPFWHAKGTTLYQTLADYMRRELSGEGYQEVRTPLVFNKKLWEKSGHWEHYRENMFQIDSEGESFALKAMNCPAHMLMFASEGRSYRDLPLRFYDQGVLHRQEASGVVSGLTRVRQLSQDDAHCFITEEQISEEVERLLKLVSRIYGDFQLDYNVELSTRPEHYIGTVETWDHAEQQLKSALNAANSSYSISAGDGSFYGPKIDIHVTDAIGRSWQCATIQLDYQMPQRFGLKYIGADNAEHTPVLIHRAIFGSFERFIAVLIEHFAGALPLWLSPVQLRILTIADRHIDHGQSVLEQLTKAGFRGELDKRQEKIGLKIREAQLQKVPYMLVIGDREVGNGTVALRNRKDGDQGSRTISEVINSLTDEVRLKRTPIPE
ncbi:MAG TPA: threonine--tRNA ligase [Acidobacteria bacterium]|nr:threonine--tRNA ligase [Acidobacteriota bacterium]